MESIISFCNNHYLGKINTSAQNLIQLVLSNKDPWLTLYNSNLYDLQMMGFELEYCRDRIRFTNVNKVFSEEIPLHSNLIAINGIDADASLETRTAEFRLLIETEDKIKKELELRKPNINKVKNTNIKRSIGKNTIYYKITLFDCCVFENLDLIMEENDEVVIDLTDCMGGAINKMLEVLTLFTTQQTPIHIAYIDSHKQQYKRVIKSDKTELDIKRIIIVTSNRTASSAEIFIMYLCTLFDCVIIGEKTREKLVIQKSNTR